MPAIRCTDLKKHFADVKAVDGVDLEVRDGECFGLLGPNGAGKTTTVEMFEGLTEPTAGEIEILGMRWGGGHRSDHALRERLGIQLQETQLGDKQSVAEVLRLFRSLYSKGRDPEEVLALLELGPKRDARVYKLSGGQRQRLALACALVSSPDLLFLDEPTTGLDPQARLNIWGVVEEYRQRGGTVVMTTHYMEEAAQLCDRIAIMDEGKIIALGSPAELIASLGADQIIELEVDGGVGAGDLEAVAGVEGVTERLDKWVLNVTQVKDALPGVLAVVDAKGAQLRNIATHQATLDDVFIHLTGKGLRDA